MSSDNVYASIPAGSVEYDREKAAISIDDLIQQLMDAKDEGATHIVGLSGNYRGAAYVQLGDVEIEFAEDDEDY